MRVVLTVSEQIIVCHRTSVGKGDPSVNLTKGKTKDRTRYKRRIQEIKILTRKITQVNDRQMSYRRSSCVR